MEQIYELKIPDKNQIKKYTITSAMRLNVFGQLIERVETVNASVYLEVENDKIIYYYEQTGYKGESSNEDFFAWISIVNNLLSDIRVTCDDAGKITRIFILNLDYRCYEIQQQLETRYKKNKAEIKELMNQIETFVSDNQNIVNQLNKSGFHQVLFSGTYGKYIIDKTIKEKKVVENLVNGISVPVLLDTNFRIDPKLSEYTLIKNGELDMENFDKKALTRWLKDATDTYDLKVDCGADVEEIYIFDKDHWIKQADSYFSFLAANLYECSYAYQIIQDVEAGIPEKKETNRWVILEK
jgi:hypothetical protein